ncbi:hypothetical protein BaRGS_00030108 [Batillaria attramentaria]|uniref:Receptor-binding cancer antigen expressed on SiSo cells n=1 Tax=Batillaria attramentaria TaxID=370345 RepID=A0ABD0JVL8_9CAEN
MLKVVFNVVKSLFSLILTIFRPLRRLWCRRLRASEQDPGVPTMVNSQSMTIDIPQSFGGDEEYTLHSIHFVLVFVCSRRLRWNHGIRGTPIRHLQHSPIILSKSRSQYSAVGTTHNARGRRTEVSPDPEPEPEPDYFQDMQPEVKKAAKILVKKKDNGAVNMSAISSRLAVMGDTNPLVSELQSWEEGDNSWADEASEDLSWEAEAAIREKRRAERQERMMEQQRRKQQRDAMRGLKKDSSIAVKIS